MSTWKLTLVAAALLGVAACRKTTPPQQFNSAEEAAAAFIDAAEKFDEPALLAILGSEGKPLVSSKDKVQDRRRSVEFAAEARAQHRIELDSAGTTAILSVGDSDWPVPMPIVKEGATWHFDAGAGAEEVLLRRIGRNELDAIEVCRGFVEAEREYALTKHDGAKVNQYAQRIISTPGKQDGLAWRNADGTWGGPVGEGIARVIAEGYSDRYEPFHGYYFKILKGQGPAAPMGEMDFRVKDVMIGGFALVAAPAEYEVTGVKTFIVSHNGIVYEKDLGPETRGLFTTMDRYNPDSTWTPVPTDEAVATP
ncbi:MAG TPA: DUF2950 domain-containing protein [Gemmatimonadales bacterium]|nr:DUF2950 domain-containing protein [Gemmatimonadales bacterium]